MVDCYYVTVHGISFILLLSFSSLAQHKGQEATIARSNII